MASEKRTLDLVACKKKDIGNGKAVYKCTTKDGAAYDCWESKVEGFIGKGPSEFRVFSSERNGKTDWYIDLKDTGDRQGGGKWGGGKWDGGKTYTPSFKDTADGARLTAKTMVLSYCKDLASSHAATSTVTFDTRVENVKKAYAALLPLVGLDHIQDSKPAADTKQPAAGGNGTPAGTQGNGHKTLAELQKDMGAQPTVDAMGAWWTKNNDAILALSAEDLKTLISDKDKKKAELTKRGPKF